MPARALIAAALLIALSPAVTGCGDGHGGFKPENPFREVTSPDNLVYNMALCFTRMNYDEFVPLIADGFTFVFNADDVRNYPDHVPQDGAWGKTEFLCAVERMLDPDYVPEHPDQQILSMVMELALSGSAVASNVQGVPPGTMEGYVTLDLRVATAGEVSYLVNSRPRFYFTPDSTKTPVTWQLWQVVDAPFGRASSIAHRQDTATYQTNTAGSGQPSLLPGASTCLPAKSELPSWGRILANYAGSCK